MIAWRDHFNVDETRIGEIMGIALSRGGDFCDLFFQHTIENHIVHEEGIVKEGRQSIHHGVGIRVVKGEGTGYAYTCLLYTSPSPRD